MTFTSHFYLFVSSLDSGCCKLSCGKRGCCPCCRGHPCASSVQVRCFLFLLLSCSQTYDCSVSVPIPDLLGFDADENSALAASVLWSEMELGANYSFSVATSDAEFAAYIVPSPVDLPTTVSAHWMTDVIGINPSCTWASTNISAPIQLQANQSLGTTAGIYLENLDLDVIITNFNYGIHFDSALTTY